MCEHLPAYRKLTKTPGKYQPVEKDTFTRPAEETRFETRPCSAVLERAVRVLSTLRMRLEGQNGHVFTCCDRGSILWEGMLNKQRQKGLTEMAVILSDYFTWAILCSPAIRVNLALIELLENSAEV